ncbi:unnamed protein product [Effrenium voratum]|uniref:Uncharacterized protein n=1 Tax=Effrenium voratum TaxID=2562239 RepID=A0AA36HQJ8_9DINO|nr:unnamed protein product [Effrenium voratum]
MPLRAVLQVALVANPTHYGDPKTGCETDEQAVRVQGLSGDFCSPKCDSQGSCPSDVPTGDKATPECALRTTTGDKYCALVCESDSDCGTGSCQKIMGTGLCTYDASALSSVATLAQARSSVEFDDRVDCGRRMVQCVERLRVKHAQVAALANPTHYGDPKTGCETDEQAVRVQGLSGDFCSPKCDSQGSCPSDVPTGDKATPECALRTTTGDKYCALVCESDTDCGTGSCQKIMGTGLCTYDASALSSVATLTQARSSVDFDERLDCGGRMVQCVGRLRVKHAQVAALANPTHYGDPKTGCETDEQAVRVQGLSGDFCSPKCDSQGSCPSDVPTGDKATPECALRTTTGDKYCALVCESDTDCGTGSCQKIMGTGLCTYDASALSNMATLTQARSNVDFDDRIDCGRMVQCVGGLRVKRAQVAALANPTHYGDPKTGCETDEQAVRVQGLSGDFCSPKCDSQGSCPSDVPTGDKATPECALRTTTGDKYCALVCESDTDCGTGSCQKIMGTGLCTYDASALSSMATLTQVAALANPTHYGDPKTGCETDEQAVRVQGLSGDFCSPKCDSQGSCPSDVPTGDKATPECALRTTTGDKYCALVCESDTDCGTGSCQKIMGTGLCTYDTSALSSVATLTQVAALANPTHYGDPKTGCETDEQAVRVQGLSGDFCSPKCDSQGSCPSDVPTGDKATPECALRTTTGDKYCALMCESDSDCGTGSCQKIMGTGLCTYDASALSSMATLTQVAALANPTHYGDPKTGCETDEQAVRVQGLSGDFCSPKCDSQGSCPSDVPTGDKATPECALRTTTGDKYCALVCESDSDCGSGSCQKIMGTGLCTYDASALSSMATLTQVAALANPTHYGDPKTGCETDEQAVRVQGLSGDFCSPKCDSQGSCPSDVPTGDKATPECALRTTTGDKYCALVCESDSDCGTGSCQKIMGTGLCTYDTSALSSMATLTQVAALANPTHYGDPKTGCETDEQAVRVQGLSGDFCSPKCDSQGSCPSDVPTGDKATPECALRTTTGDKYCALVCESDSDCGTGSCQKIMGTGLCTYDASALSSVATLTQVAALANPTHYGDPKTGCETDEQAVRVQGLSGDFCSPKCDSQGSCPSDVPTGDKATPECALRTTTGDKYCALVCESDSDCGTGSCQKIMGTGLCTYDASALSSVATLTQVAALANPTHYGDPKTGCETDEQAVRVQGLSGDFCSPKCDSQGSCPSDVPTGDKATPECALRTTTGDKYCALVCESDSDCGTGSCQKIMGTGLCTYDASAFSSMASLTQVAALANPTHYGDPKTGCETDEQAVRVQGLSGDFCSPKCDSQGSCPSDVPTGDKATPECALRTTTGDKYCALVCESDSDCGTGSCQKIMGTGLCTYDASALSSEATLTQVAALANPTHYGDPKTGCETDEQAVRVQGLSGDFCSPKCDSQGSCPSDVPTGDKATPECALRTTTGDKYCALVCESDSDCGTGSCQKIMGTGLCTYDASALSSMATLTQVAALANPTHYGDPKTGCETDEQAVRVQGLSGDFCSPKCDSQGSCPSDVPTGDKATPECALRTTTGDKYCALVCESDSDCGTGSCQKIMGTGSCQKIMGTGLCTYDASALSSVATLTQVAALANPTHYGDPKTGCETDEQAVRVQGLSGDFCSPKCDSQGSCPSDVPTGDKATPECALRTTTGDKYCALVCESDSDCGTGSCQKIMGTGLCTYDASALSSMATLTQVAALANPTHYGDPKTGCETDEQAVRVQGLSGDFCSPKCDSQGSCPSDVPTGDKATPECALRTTTGDKYCALVCESDSDCGTGSCQKIMGTGLCTYDASALSSMATLTQVAALANPTHYGDPKTGCETDEQAVRVQGLSGDFCSPKCDSQGSCPSDVPTGDKATPECALRTTTGDKYCALVCESDSDCGTGSCQKIMGTGLCTYDASALSSMATLTQVAALANPTHYGDPKTGCETDEQAVRVQGLSGDFCSPKCDSQGSCPSDVPTGDKATPECALRTTTGDKYCALVCESDSDCGTGSCQKIMGTGLCTYDASALSSMATLTQVAALANPTHYGDPKTGCETDEQAVRVQGLSGDFCSPKCDSQGSCPSDVPTGDKATPECALRTTTGDKYCALVCESDSDCGTGSCQKIMGTGLSVRVQGLSGDFCSPKCDSQGSCPSDVPTGDKATPECALRTTTGDKYCALVCESDSDCGTGSCQKIMGTGLCTYASSASAAAGLQLLPEARELIV